MAKNKFGLDFDIMFQELLPIYVDNGFMTKNEEGYAFTAKGMYVSNYILSRLVGNDLIIPGSNS